MMGLAKETICMSLEEAAEYIAAKIVLLEKEKEGILDKLDDVDAELEIEYANLKNLADAPSLKEKKIHHICQCHNAE